MLRIAIVEDEKECQASLIEYLSRYEKEHNDNFIVRTFFDGIDILDDYTSKATKLRNAGTTGLILDDEMQKVLMETFGKLSSLYLEVNDMKNAQKESKVSIDECQKYREEINQSLAALSFEEEKGQSRDMRQ